MKAYLDIVQKILDEGEYKDNRTGIGTYAIAGAMFQHDMSKGFPILTTKKIAVQSVFAELEFFIKGITDKKWLQDRKCYIWDEWGAKPDIMDKYLSEKDFPTNEKIILNKRNIEELLDRVWHKYNNDYTSEEGTLLLPKKNSAFIDDIKSLGYFSNPESLFIPGKPMEIEWQREPTTEMLENLTNKTDLLTGQLNRDLGPIYGWQWRHFGAEYIDYKSDYSEKGIDQLANVVNTLKKNPGDRRMIVSAWNPEDLDEMALPACHYGFQVTVINGKLNLLWNQRSVDTPLGLPFNITSYALLLHLLAKESGLKEGTLTGFLADVHIYKNQVDGVKEQLTRNPNTYQLPTVETENFTSIFDWKYTDTKIIGYESYPKIDFGKVAV